MTQSENNDTSSHGHPARRCGYVAITGRPNTGKSTLLNRLVGQKISITSRKPQTTRHHMLGIKNTADAQILYLDTPGIQSAPGDAINRYMNREATNVLADVDVIIFMIEAMHWSAGDETVLEYIKKYSGRKVVLVINKTDRIRNKQELIPFIEQVSDKLDFSEIVPMCSRSASDVARLESVITRFLPRGVPEYPDDQITNRSSRFLAAEFIREKLMQHLGDELPYKLAVTIDRFKEAERCTEIHATIWVEREGQKKIIIGKQGYILKTVGQQARKDLEKLLDQKIYLKTWVRVKRKWTSDERALKQFNYE